MTDLQKLKYYCIVLYCMTGCDDHIENAALGNFPKIKPSQFDVIGCSAGCHDVIGCVAGPACRPA